MTVSHPKPIFPPSGYADYNRGMSEPQKKPVWPWFVALLIGLPVLYIASFGPACWICDRVDAYTLWRKIETIYRPILSAWNDGAEPIGKVVSWYANLGVKKKGIGIHATDDRIFLMESPGSSSRGFHSR
jgi:hypothetical protein